MVNVKYLDAQNAVLGAMLIDATCIGDVLSKTRPDEFSGACGTIYSAIRKMFSAGEVIDPVTVLAKVGKDYQQMLMELMQVTPTAANVMKYVDIVHEQSMVTKAQLLGQQLAETSDPEEARDLIDKAASLLTGKQSNWKAYCMADLLELFYTNYGREPDYLDWGIDKLNQRIYAEAGDFIIVGGRPSVGKTALAIEFAMNMSKRKRVGFFSFETGPSKFTDRLMAHAFALDLSDIKHRRLSMADFSRINAAQEGLTTCGLTFVPSNGMRPEDITSFALAFKFDIVFVDYLQIVNSGLRNAVSMEQTRAISMGLHNLAQSNGITVVSLAQLSRPRRGDEDIEPGLESLKESGQIEQDADVIMFLYRKEAGVRNSPRILKVAKNKEGICGSIELNFEGRYQNFSASNCDVDDDLGDEALSQDLPESDSEPSQMSFDDDDDYYEDAEQERRDKSMKNIKKLRREGRIG